MPTKTCLEESASPVRPYTLTECTQTDVVRRKSPIALRLFAAVDSGEATIHRWLMRYSITALRISIGTVILGFGFLKYFPGLSPAQDLVLADARMLTFGLLPGGVTMALLATAECAIGLLLITGRWLRLTSYLLFFWIVGILSPIALLAG